MKISIFFSTVLLTLFSNSAYSASDDFSFSIGAVSWYSRYNPISRIAGMDTPKSTYAFMNGPAIFAKYKNLYLDITYLLPSNDYDTIGLNTIVKPHHADADSAANRTDIDVIFGYMLTPKVSMNVGYKGIFVDDNITLTSQGVTTDGRRTETYNVGTVGAGLHMPIGHKIMWISNVNTLLGSFHNEVAYPANYRRLNEPVYDALAWGGSVDTKATYTIINHLSANIGLKCLYIKAGSDNSSFFGPTAGIDYSF